MKFNLSHKQLKEAERSVYSQAGQDGVLEVIFKQMGIEEGQVFDIGAGDGRLISNTANLRFNHDWKGLLIDAEPLSPIVEKYFITKESINDKSLLFGQIEYVSIDIDGNDYWIWETMEGEPYVLSIEYNSKFSNDESYAIEYNPNHVWEGDDYYGASLLALKKLGERKGYTLVHIVGELDAFFIRNDLLDESYVAPSIEELLPSPIIAHEKISNKKWVKI